RLDNRALPRLSRGNEPRLPEPDPVSGLVHGGRLPARGRAIHHPAGFPAALLVRWAGARDAPPPGHLAKDGQAGEVAPYQRAAADPDVHRDAALLQLISADCCPASSSLPNASRISANTERFPICGTIRLWPAGC